MAKNKGKKVQVGKELKKCCHENEKEKGGKKTSETELKVKKKVNKEKGNNSNNRDVRI